LGLSVTFPSPEFFEKGKSIYFTHPPPIPRSLDPVC